MLFVFIFLSLLWAFLLVEKKKVSFSLFKILIIAFGLRVLSTLLFVGSKSDDILSFVTLGEVVVRGASNYPSLYFPFIAYLGGASVLLKNFLNPLLFLRLVFSLFDVGTVWLIVKLTKNKRTALLYTLNPLSIIVFNIHGQMDAIPIFFFLLSIYTFLRRKEVWTSLILSFAIFTKAWPALFVLPLWKRFKNKLYFLAIAIFPVVSVFLHSWLFGTMVQDIISPIQSYRGVYDVWGIGNILALIKPYVSPAFLELGIVKKSILASLFLAVYLTFCLLYRRKKITSEILGIMLFFFSFTPTFGAQWLTWLLPFLFIERPRGWKTWFVIATVYIGVTFFGDAYKLSKQQVVWRDTAVTVLGFIVWGQIVRLFYMHKHHKRQSGF